MIIKNSSTSIANTNFLARFQLNSAVFSPWQSNLSRKKWMIENNKCTHLVICGSNLGSTVNFIYYNRFIRNIINIPINLNSIILGIILSDGHLFKNKANNTLFSFLCFWSLPWQWLLQWLLQLFLFWLLHLFLFFCDLLASVAFVFILIWRPLGRFCICEMNFCPRLR